jgi:hypothetical protein
LLLPRELVPVPPVPPEPGVAEGLPELLVLEERVEEGGALEVRGLVGGVG